MAQIDSTETRYSDWSAKAYSDPRMRAEIEGWPIGREKRATAVFEVETNPKRGQRVSRTTIGKPVKTTFAALARIVTGDDGRTYIAELTPYSGNISIMRGDMKYSHEYITPDDPRFLKIKEEIFNRNLSN